MTSKDIRISEEVYDLLKSVQHPQESISGTIERLYERYSANNLRQWVESLPSEDSITDETWNSLEVDVQESRNRR